MKTVLTLCFLCFVLSGTIASYSPAQGAPDSPPASDVPPNSLDRCILPFHRGDDTEKQVIVDLAGIKPEVGGEPQTQVTGDNRFILHGNLFKNGKAYALVELPGENEDTSRGFTGGPTALAEYVAGHWLLRGLWKIDVDWQSPLWRKSEIFQHPDKVPFALVNFAGDGVPEVLFAGEAEAYYHYYYLFRFDSKANTLRLLMELDHEPSGGKGYLVRSVGSGRRKNDAVTVFLKTEYMKWEKQDFILKAESHDIYWPMEGGDPTILNVMQNDGTAENFKIDGTNTDIRTIARNGKPYAIVTFHPAKDLQTGVAACMEDNWLFERLIGLPEELTGNDAPRLEKHGSYSVTGTKDALRRLSSAKD